jgi:peptidoglycan/xylan/chitin deacetylase (PgdA/CDA1 family)
MVKAGAAAVPAPAGTVVLIYHRVGAGTPLDVDLDRGEFDRQLAWLAHRGRTVPLETALAGLATAEPAPAPSVVVTFDDGTADFADVALPILVEHGIPVTLYLATAFVEEQRPFADDGLPLSWSALRDACATGLVDVGSHTHTHAVLDRLPAELTIAELDRSRQLIEDRLGRPCLDFAYPKALPPSPGADAAVRERFRSAALGGTRANRPGRTDVHRLARSPIQRSDGTKYFEKKVAGGMGFEDSLRRVANVWRYRGVST